MAAETEYVSIHQAARELGVPLAWLKREAEAGRIPCLRVGRRLLFDVPAVRQALGKNAAPQEPRYTSLGHAADYIGVSPRLLLKTCQLQPVPGAIRVPFGPEETYVFELDKLVAWVRSLEGSAS